MLLRGLRFWSLRPVASLIGFLGSDWPRGVMGAAPPATRATEGVMGVQVLPATLLGSPPPPLLVPTTWFCWNCPAPTKSTVGGLSGCWRPRPFCSGAEEGPGPSRSLEGAVQLFSGSRGSQPHSGRAGPTFRDASCRCQGLAQVSLRPRCVCDRPALGCSSLFRVPGPLEFRLHVNLLELASNT